MWTKGRDSHVAALSNAGPSTVPVVLEPAELVRGVHAFFWGRSHSCRHGREGVCNPRMVKVKPDPSQSPAS